MSRFTSINIHSWILSKALQGTAYVFQVVGFVMWTVNRQGEGPAKAYQFLDGNASSLSIKGCGAPVLKHVV